MVSATTRVTLGLICLVISVWLVSYLLGMFPDNLAERTDGRVKLSENIALNCSLFATRNDLPMIEESLRKLLERNSEVLSAGIRRPSGELLMFAGPHDTQWTLKLLDKSTSTQMRVPILEGQHLWGNVELRFRERPGENTWVRKYPLLGLGIFANAVTFILFFIYLRGVLRHLDPTKVIPRRVRQTLDSMAGGLLVLDTEQRILLANQAFADTLGTAVEDVLGRKACDLPFVLDKDGPPAGGYAWERAVSAGEAQFGDIMTLRDKDGQPRLLKVSAAPVQGDDGRLRGAMVSFDDVTQLRAQQEELRGMLQKLSQSRDEIERQNLELERLASRDSLTGCLNRRAFFHEFERVWNGAGGSARPVACIMVDLDHFKRINDVHGHQLGDFVLQRTAQLLVEGRAEADVVCRYGGEEFCLLLPDMGIEQAAGVADRIRRTIEATDYQGVPVTASIGVSVRELGATNANELIDQADKCLYVAKRHGRNRVVRYDVAAKQLAERPAAERDGASASSTGTAADASIPFNAVAALLSALAYRDQATADHARRVADLCVGMSRRLMSASESYLLEVAALLHDVGKIGVPDSILLKPGKLTSDEWQVMDSQHKIGLEILSASFASATLTEIIRVYRAWYGGDSRHPELPSGNAIPLAARILAIADAYDAITNRNAYREAMTREQAIAELRRNAGRQFDPELVEQFIDSLEVGAPAGTATPYDSGRIANIAARLEAATRSDADIGSLVRLTNELVEVCQSAQRSLLANRKGN
jgi:diguanylate cyclase (GGDEF)-like protein/PAS domain S-box-containing protein